MWKWILIIFALLIIYALFSGDDEDSASSSNTQPENTASEEVTKEAANTEETSQESVSSEESAFSAEDFVASCEDFDYKKIMRNPDDFVGKNFKVTVQIFSSSEGSLFQDAYYKAYTDDGSETYFDNMIYLFDEQDENSEGYVHMLDDDILTVYGTFEGTVESKNYLNGERSQDIALHVKYAELVSE